MAKQVFLSYSTDDSAVVTAIRDQLEMLGIDCWMAPRDITPGEDYADQIITAIETTVALVLVLSESSNRSIYVRNEVERAVAKDKVIIPFLIHRVKPSRSLEFFISNKQWIEAWEPPLHVRVNGLAEAIRKQLDGYESAGGISTAAQVVATAAISPPVTHVVPHNLPHQLTPFVGREEELAALDDLLVKQAARLVTILGPGGMGKTCLSLAVAERHLTDQRFAHGIFFVSLAPLSEVEYIVPRLAEALSFPLLTGAETRTPQQLLDYLRTKQMLLLFDNFEHLLDGVDLVVQILQAAPQICILASSRERLRAPGEHVFPIQGLDYNKADRDGREAESAAVRLFIQSARQIQSDLILTEEDLAHVAHICQLVDGMPLGLELAAAWIEVLSPQEIAAEIVTSLDFLKAERRGGREPHHSIRAIFDSTWQRLDQTEQSVFSRLALFRGGFTRDAAEQVADASLRLLSTLVGKSLIQHRRSEGRYTLHELLRQYAAEKLFATSEHEEIGARFLRYFLHLAETAEPHLRGVGRAEWMISLVSEHYNLRLAFDWACSKGKTEQALRLAAALLPYWLGHGAWAEGTHCIATALALHNADNTTNFELRTFAKALYAAGLFAWHQSDYARAISCTDESLRLCQQLGDDFGSAQAFHLLGLTARAQRDFPQATHCFSASLDLARKCDDKLLIATILSDMGLVAWRQNDFIKAGELFEESLAYREVEQDAHGVAQNFQDLGNLAYWQGDLERARIFGERSLAAFRQLADPFYIAQSISILANVAYHQNELDKAQSLREQALDYFQTLSAQRSIAINLLKLGQVWRQRSNLAVASQLYGEATVLLRRIGDHLNLIYALEAWLFLAVRHSKFETAARLSGTVEAWRERLGTPRPPVETSEYDHHIADVRTALGESAFKIAWAEGKDLSLDEALDYALSKEQALLIAA